MGLNAHLMSLIRLSRFNTVYKEFVRNEPSARTTRTTARLGILVKGDCVVRVKDDA